MEKDLMRSFKIRNEESSGKQDLKTEESIDLYPLIEDTDKPLFLNRKRRKSATLGMEGREME